MADREKIYDELLTLRCIRSEPGALNELIKRWEDRLFYYLRRFMDNEQDAWDVLQETFIKVARKISSINEPKSISPWLYSVARNTALTHIRHQKVEMTLLEEIKDLGNTVGDTDPFTAEDADLVNRTLPRLSLPHREILTLFFLEDFTLEEISEIIKVPSGTVKSRLYYAKKAFKTLVESNGEQS